LGHDNASLRAWGVRAAGNMGNVSNEARELVTTLRGDSSPDVVLQVAIAARKIEGIEPIPVFVDILANCGTDKLIPHIVWQNLHPLLPTQSANFLAEVKKHNLKESPALAKIMPRVTERILAGNKK